MIEKITTNALPSLATSKCVSGTAENSGVAGRSPTSTIFSEENTVSPTICGTVETKSLPPARQFSTVRLLVAHIGYLFVHRYNTVDANTASSAAMALFLATTDAVCFGLDKIF